MKNYLALDSGGTKLAAVLFDSELRRLGVCVSGSIRPNTTPEAERVANMEAVIRTLGLEGREIEAIGGCAEADFIGKIREIANVRSLRITGEADTALAAAGVFGDGILSIAGTGSSVFTRLSGKLHALGGYGNLVSDEGSGYWIGRMALAAAIHDVEGRGVRTALTEKIAREISGNTAGREAFRDAVFSMYRKGRRSPASVVAGLTPLVVRTASEGDGKAREILLDAGRLQAEQVVASINLLNTPSPVPVVLAGSVWRKNPVYFDEFCRIVRETFPEREIIVPEFEPIMGFPMKVCGETVLAAGNNVISREITDRLKAEFPEFIYDLGAEKLLLKTMNPGGN